MIDIAKIFICKIYKEAISQKYNDSKISQYTVYVFCGKLFFFALSNYSEYKLSCDTCVGRMLLVVPEIQACTSYYVAVACAIHGARNTDQLTVMNGLLWLQHRIIATCHGFKVSNAQGFQVQATVEKDQVKEIAWLLMKIVATSTVLCFKTMD